LPAKWPAAMAPPKLAAAEPTWATVMAMASAAASFGGAIAAGHFAGKRDLQGRDTFVTAPAGVLCLPLFWTGPVTVTVTAGSDRLSAHMSKLY
jgi:hypothetical protein